MARTGIPLTPEREAWAKKFKPDNVSRGTILEYNAAIAERYRIEVDKLIAQMTKEIEKELRKLYKSDASKEYFVKDAREQHAMDASIASQSRIITNDLMRKYSKLFKDRGKTISKQMLGGIDKTSEKALETSLKSLSGGLKIDMGKVTGDVQEVAKSSLNANTKLITSIQERYFDQIVGAVDRSIMTGGGLKELIPAIEGALKDQKRIAKNRSKNIALDQTRKAYNSINKARMESVGITKFEWLHSGGGQDPRRHHQAKWPAGLNGGIFSFDDLPVIDEKTGERGIPGQAVNCKCRMRPVIEWDNGEQSS